MAEVRNVDPSLIGKVGSSTPGETTETKSADPKRALKKTTDAQRVLQNAGYNAKGTGAQRGLPDLGDSSRAPIPLPKDDVNPEAWAAGGLRDVQEYMTHLSASLREMLGGSEAQGDEGFLGAVLSKLFQGKDGDGAVESSEGNALAQLQDIDDPEIKQLMARVETAQERQAPIPDSDMAKAMKHLGELLGQAGTAEDIQALPQGQQLMAVALAVAGMNAKPGSAKTTVDHLRDGVAQATTQALTAVRDAQSMQHGIDSKINLQRTMVYNRNR